MFIWRRGERGREEEEGQAGEKKGKERQTERKTGIIGNVYVGEVEKTLYSLTSICDSTFLYQNFK